MVSLYHTEAVELTETRNGLRQSGKVGHHLKTSQRMTIVATHLVLHAFNNNTNGVVHIALSIQCCCLAQKLNTGDVSCARHTDLQLIDSLLDVRHEVADLELPQLNTSVHMQGFCTHVNTLLDSNGSSEVDSSI